MNKYLIPAVIIAAGVLVAGAFVFINYWPSKILSSQKAAEKAMAFINENIEEGMIASLISVVDEGRVYKIHLKIAETEYDSYITKDGKFLFPTGISLAESATEQETVDTEQTAVASESFAKCLTEKGMKFYGSKNCGWCAKEKEAFGDSFQYINYVECIDDDEQFSKTCQDANITSFPTWQLPDGTMESGFKTLEQLAEVSGCSL